ncbi:MAG: SufS family cysteine desulfurase [Solirubrobacteraceae bacterium]|nr:SufS family cysteine desulfurase [Solirubrobacteraceae bacterium]
MAATADTLDVRGEFPVLERADLVYLDSGATSQKPRAVIEAMDDFTRHHNASVHRGVYPLAVEATDRFEAARSRAAAWLNAPARGTVFTKNASEAINLVAYAWGLDHVGEGDTIVVTEMEHHSNVVSWQLLARRVGATLAYVPIDDDGRLVLDELDRLLERGPKLVAVAHVSNVLGTINPVAEIVARARAAGAVTLVDGAQAVPQIPVDVGAIGADFYVWTAHKAYGPTGLGVLHGRPELLESMSPFLGGGHMIASVDEQTSTWADIPAKFEAGTSPIAEAVGMGAAVAWLQGIGMERVRAHEQDLVAYALERLAEIPGITLHGPRDPRDRGAVVSFALDYAHPHDVSEIVARRGVCVRAGHHCAQPLMRRLGVPATTRASFAVHNDRSDVDALVTALHDVHEVFG